MNDKEEPLPPLPDWGPTDGVHGEGADSPQEHYSSGQDASADEADEEPEAVDDTSSRAAQPGGALSPGNTATGRPTGDL